MENTVIQLSKLESMIFSLDGFTQNLAGLHPKNMIQHLFSILGNPVETLISVNETWIIEDLGKKYGSYKILAWHNSHSFTPIGNQFLISVLTTVTIDTE
ncbi:hypothetical protein [Herpetosiphon sp. NSE202]|uniref:hypothetical protein n=1 Tax=Herpetosiphon sp. NSE202 TaxID=3351349 RepID=UPI003645DF10